MDEEGQDEGGFLEAYRAKREQATSQAKSDPPAPVRSLSPPPTQGTETATGPALSASHAALAPGPGAPAAATKGPQGPAHALRSAEHHESAPSAARLGTTASPAVVVPAVIASPPARSSSARAAAPGRRASDAPGKKIRGLLAGRILGATLMLAGLALYALGQRAARAGEVPRWAFGHPASTSAAGVFVAGLLVAAVFLFLPARPNRAPQVAEVRAMATLAAGGLGVACLGVVAAAACFRYVGDRFLVAGLAVAAFVAIVGAAVSLASAARADGLRRAAAAPARGLDADTAGVLRSLDALLGELPESAVHRFVASPEGDAYLRLLDAMEDGDA